MGKPFADHPGDLVRADVKSLPGLVATGREIADLRGIEAMAGLLSLNVNGNRVADLSRWPASPE